MKRSIWIVAVTVVALTGMMACSDSDDIIDTILPAGPQAEAILEGAFAEVVEPVSGLLEGIGDLIANPKVFVVPPELECPTDTSSVCTSGSLTCDADSSGLLFDFDTCDVALDPVIVDGEVQVAPTGEGSYLVTLDTVSFDGGTPMSGTIGVNGAACSQEWAITTADGVSLLGSVIVCTDYPGTGSTLTITFINGGDVWVATFTFDGTEFAGVTVVRNDELAADCDMSMDTFEADCESI